MKTLLSLALLGAVAAGASAQSLLYTGALDAGSPTYNRASSSTGLSGNTAVAYSVQPFFVSAAGNYTFEAQASGSTLDTYIYVYANRFDPGAALTNLVNGDDDYGSTAGSPFTVLSGSSTSSLTASRIFLGDTTNYNAGGLPLTAGTPYFAVVAAFSNAGSTSAARFGAFRAGIGGGPGAVTAGAPVPEPASMAVLGLGALGLLRRRRKG